VAVFPWSRTRTVWEHQPVLRSLCQAHDPHGGSDCALGLRDVGGGFHVDNLLGAVVSQIFGAPPYNMSTVAVGNLTGIAPFIGSALGTVFGSWACDKTVQILAARNNGVYEPEFRLLVIPVATVPLTQRSFCLSAALHAGLSAIVCAVFMAIMNFGVGVVYTGIVTYTNEAYSEQAGDVSGLTIVSLFQLIAYFHPFN
jgi:hypothetical protein